MVKTKVNDEDQHKDQSDELTKKEVMNNITKRQLKTLEKEDRKKPTHTYYIQQLGGLEGAHVKYNFQYIDTLQ